MLKKSAARNLNQDKLIKILNLMDSPMEGEVLAAARSAMRYLKTRGISWRDVIRQKKNTLLKNPSSWALIELQDPTLVKRTEKAALLSVKLTHGGRADIWFPRSTLRERESKIFVAQWILKKKEKELSKEGVSARILIWDSESA